MDSPKTKMDSFFPIKRYIFFTCCSAMALMCYILINREYFYDYLLSVQTLKTSKSTSVIQDKYVEQNGKRNLNIGILIVVDGPETYNGSKTAKDSLACYAKIQNYTLEVVYTSNHPKFTKLCPHREFMFKRHCITTHIIPKYDWLLFLDGDIGVINPHHRIEEYIDESVNIIFYDRFFDWEVATGSYLAKKSTYAIEFFNKLANFEYRLPASNHGLDNGVIHVVFMEELAPNAVIERQLCERLLNKSKGLGGLFAFEACARMVLGANRYWTGKLKIITKGIGWTRDGWLTGTKFCTRDFMFHGWKQNKLGEGGGMAGWLMPFKSPEDLATCANGFAGWAVKPNFSISVHKIEVMLRKKYVEVEKEFLAKVGSLANEVV